MLPVHVGPLIMTAAQPTQLGAECDIDDENYPPPPFLPSPLPKSQREDEKSDGENEKSDGADENQQTSLNRPPLAYGSMLGNPHKAGVLNDAQINEIIYESTKVRHDF